jgi:hypothetical protein
MPAIANTSNLSGEERSILKRAVVIMVVFAVGEQEHKEGMKKPSSTQHILAEGSKVSRVKILKQTRGKLETTENHTSKGVSEMVWGPTRLEQKSSG